MECMNINLIIFPHFFPLYWINEKLCQYQVPFAVIDVQFKASGSDCSRIFQFGSAEQASFVSFISFSAIDYANPMFCMPKKCYERVLFIIRNLFSMRA